MRRILASLGLAVAALAAQTATAAPAGFFELSNFRVDVQDLAQDDGVAAEVEFAKGWDFLQAQQRTSSGVGKQADGFNVDQVLVATQHGLAIASTDGALYRTSVEHERGWLDSAASFGGDFSMTAFTRVVFSFDWRGMNVRHAGSEGNEVSVESAATMAAWFGQDASAGASLAGFGTLESGTLSLAFDTGADGVFGNLTVNLWSSGADTLPPENIPAVPEPSGIALLLAGLACLTAWRWRGLRR
ncbi:PEP-CTERM sorting domain-containing protein [Oxalobacteraceae bacterium]|nr:PEP-CTERM sorting domain-containing protein [Oxalobacteraceae bacterium]